LRTITITITEEQNRLLEAMEAIKLFNDGKNKYYEDTKHQLFVNGLLEMDLELVSISNNEYEPCYTLGVNYVAALKKIRENQYVK
jgi:hypothetical protein